MGDFVTEIRKIPPITRFVCASCLAVTLSTMMGLVSGYQFIYTFSLAFKKLQIWRLYTSFFFGSGGITFIFEFVLLYRTMNDLESGPYLRRSADFGWQLFVAGVAILITSIPVSSMIFFRPFLLCLAYISSALAPVGTMTSVMGLVQLPVKYFPYVMLGFDLLLGGPGAVATSLPGAVVGHLWWWSVWGLSSAARAGCCCSGAARRGGLGTIWARGIRRRLGRGIRMGRRERMLGGACVLFLRGGSRRRLWLRVRRGRRGIIGALEGRSLEGVRVEAPVVRRWLRREV
ncbi:Der1-like family-domain-containing protein [Mycena leptocephala]|nr:Der1-like family-domain-containing protein [Mycena leptocephala]